MKVEKLTEEQRIFKEFLEEKEEAFNKELDKEYWYRVDKAKNINEKIHILSQGVKEGSVFCKKELGLMYAGGNGVQKDLKEAEKYLKAAAKCGNLDAMYFLGMVYTNDEDKVLEALDWICKAAIRGNVGAYKTLGDYIKNRVLREQVELRLQVFYLEITNKENKNFIENRFMGWCFCEGICCRQSFDLAEMYWLEGIEQGDLMCNVLLDMLKKLLN